MDDKKRNITGSYPGAGGAKPQKRTVNPSGSYPGKKPTLPVEEPVVEQVEPIVEETPKKRLRFAELFSKETLKKYGKTLAYYGVILVASVLLAAWICSVGNELLGLIRPDREITFNIEEDSSTKEIANVLKEAELIEHPRVFEFYCKLKKADGSFRSGEYTINCKRDYNQIIRALQKKGADKTMVEFVIKAGDTQEDLVTNLCDSLKLYDRKELEEILQSYDFSEYSFMSGLSDRNYPLEGYLYPDTYETYEGESPVALVRHVLDRFEEAVLTEENQKLIAASDYTLDELIALASILQKEGGKDLKRAASVYFNRLADESYPYLESEATLDYILPMNNGKITAADLKTDDPYNTYLKKGLPPSAICSPDAKAIQAVLEPANSDYMYFITQSDQEMLFSVKETEHRANLKKAGKNLRGTGTIV